MSSRPVAPPVPTLVGAPLLGSMRALRDDYLGTISRAARELGALARINAGPPGWRVSIFVVSSPTLAAEVLGQPDRFTKDAPGYRELRAALGGGLLTSQGELWRRQRRQLAPLFTPRRVAEEYATVMTEEAERLVSRWRSLAATGQPVLAYPEMVQLAAQVIGRVLFGADVSRAVGQLVRFDRINDALLRRAVNPHPAPRRWPTPANRRLDDQGFGEVAQVVPVWTERVLRESMRLYPAAHGMARRARRRETLGGFGVPAGSWLEVSPWAIHHSPHVWSDPETFDPRRFDLPADQPPGGHRYGWIPFGAGPHVCIGMHLAMLEMRIVLRAVLRAFVLDTSLTSVPVHAAITLQPTGGLPLALRAIRPNPRDRRATGPRSVR